jgi:hypothetical protein
MGDVPLHFEATYPKLHAFAEKLFRRQPSTSTLQATALVHEVYLRALARHGLAFGGRV